MSEREFIGIPLQQWGAAALGAAFTALGTLFIQALGFVRTSWNESRPACRLLGRVARSEEPCYIFVRDFFVPTPLPVLVPSPAGGTQTISVNVPLLIKDGPTGAVGAVKNVNQLWSSVESSALSNLLYVFAVAGKNEGVHVQQMSQDVGVWDGSIIVLGAQATRSIEFYRRMKGVAYRMTGRSIVDVVNGTTVKRSGPFGYGIILKARNPLRTSGGHGVGFLIGGFGTLGTEAAGYYFRTRYRELARDFGERTFGIVIRASLQAGAASAERLHSYDRVTEPKPRFRRIYEQVVFWAHKQM